MLNVAGALRALSRRPAYDPVQYWNTRCDPNSDAGRSAARVGFDANYVRLNISPGAQVLELGPGVGRTFSAYGPDARITTLDISRLYEAELESVSARLNLQLEQHFLEDTLSVFPFSDNQFDAGVSFQVFIHQPPDVFSHTFAEMVRVCRRVIVSVGLHLNASNSAKASAAHVFAHDYILAAAKHGKLLSNVLTRDGVLYFVLHGDDEGFLQEES